MNPWLSQYLLYWCCLLHRLTSAHCVNEPMAVTISVVLLVLFAPPFNDSWNLQSNIVSDGLQMVTSRSNTSMVFVNTVCKSDFENEYIASCFALQTGW